MTHQKRREEANDRPTAGGLCLPAPQLDLRFSTFTASASDVVGAVEKKLPPCSDATIPKEHQSHFPFFLLPGELRNSVYQYYSKQEYTIELHYTMKRHNKRLRRILIRTDPLDTVNILSLARTCRQAYHESLPFIYSSNRFDFTHPWVLSRFLKKSRALDWLTKVKISANVDRTGRKRWRYGMALLGRAPSMARVVLESEGYSYRWFAVTQINHLVRLTYFFIAPFVDSRTACTIKEAKQKASRRQILTERRRSALAVVDLSRLRFRWDLPNGGVWWACNTEGSKKELREGVEGLFEPHCSLEDCGWEHCRERRRGVESAGGEWYTEGEG